MVWEYESTSGAGGGFSPAILDLWCGNNALKNSFPSVFRLAYEIEASMEDLMVISGDQVQWNITFNRAVQDWEVSNLEDFFSLMYSLRWCNQGIGTLWWIPIGKSKFSVRSFYKSFIETWDIQFSWKRIWRNKASPKASFFVWTISLCKILRWITCESEG